MIIRRVIGFYLTASSWLKKQGIEDGLIQPYSGHESRQSLEIYSKLSIGDDQKNYENVIGKFPV